VGKKQPPPLKGSCFSRRVLRVTEFFDQNPWSRYSAGQVSRFWSNDNWLP